MTRPLVLVVEDDRDTRELLRDLLVAEGYAVHLARDGEEARRWLDGPGRPDLIVLDLVLPLLDGEQLLAHRAGQARLRDLPVLVISASARPRRIPGDPPFLRKPFLLDDFLDAVAAHTAPPSQQERDQARGRPRNDAATARDLFAGGGRQTRQQKESRDARWGSLLGVRQSRLWAGPSGADWR